jgi:PKD repeat protein
LGLYVGGYSTSGPWKIRGNIIRQTSADYYNYMCYLYGAQNGFDEVDYNVFHCANTSTYLYFSPVAGGYSATWPGIISTVNSVMNTGSAPIGKTNNNLFINPLFNNIAANDYKPNAWKCNNSMPTFTGRDLVNAVRNPGVSDRGCLERYTDLQATGVSWNAGSNPCSNFSEKPSITIKNNFVDTAYDFNVSYRINNMPKVTEKVSTKMLSGSSSTYTFQTPVRLIPGQVKLQVFIDVPDDYKLNDTQTFNMNVRPAPSGGEFTLTQGLNDNRKNMEVTIINSLVKYTFTPPKYYTNGQYGASSKWTAKPFARSAGGRDVSSYISMSRTPGAQDGEITFKPTSLNDEDSFFTVGIVVNDVGNGCDSVIQRRIYVQPLGRPNFKIPAVNCLGDFTFFENTSSVKNGALDYVWYFGDGDTSIASNPVHEFKATGTYKVRLATWTTPYGFRNDTVINVTINAVPAVNFDKLNVCDGGSVTFNNKTIPASPTTYTWDFGDGSKPNTNTNPVYAYGKVGSYVVTLTASLNGCAKSISKNMYVFPKPKADFTKDAGNCENETFKFSNQSSISSGELGFYWDFDDNGTVATLKNAEHDFSSFGTKNVKLKAISEFGCVDSIVKPIDVKAAPTASFSNTAACSITPTTFTNTTAPVTGWTPTYTWNFGDGTNSAAASPVKNWTNLGPKNVTLKVELNNGCSDMVSKLLTVGIQPSAAFSAENTCAGQPMTFVNSTTWPQGDITYLWNFADGNTSTESDPNHVYNVTATRLFNVTLYAYIAGGCADSITKQVIVNEGPKTCDFDADLNYNKGFRGVDFTPKSATGTGAQAGVNYTWVYDQEGQSNGPAGYNNFQEDGVYRVTMRARNVNGCECVAVKTISINRRGVEDATGLEARINLYPNPNNGMFKVVVGAEAQQDLSIAVYNVLGAKVADVPTNGRNSGTFDVNASELSNGIYLVKITSGGQTAIRKVNIQR